MKKKLLSVLIISLVFSFILPSLTLAMMGPMPPTPMPVSGICGRVMKNCKPVSGATIVAFTPEGLPVAKTISNCFGMYRLVPLKPGDYILLCTNPATGEAIKVKATVSSGITTVPICFPGIMPMPCPMPMPMSTVS